MYKKYPNALNQAIAIRQTRNIANYPLKNGDIIWQINGQDIGPHMYKMDHIINNSKDNLAITVYRNGEKKTIQVKPSDINKHKINRMVIFGDTVFYEVNETINLITGAPLGTLFVTNSDEGSAFDRLPYIFGLRQGFDYLSGLRMIKINELNNYKATSLDELIKIIPQLIKQKYFSVNYQNYCFDVGVNNIQLFNRNNSITNAEYEGYTSDPIELRFNKKTLTWDKKKIL